MATAAAATVALVGPVMLGLQGVPVGLEAAQATGAKSPTFCSKL